MLPSTRFARPAYRAICYTPCRLSSTQQPPAPAPYRQVPADELASRRQRNTPERKAKPEPKSLIPHWLWPWGRRQQHLESQPEARREPPDIQRGIEASKRYAREGVLDERYKQPAKYMVRIICGLPIVIGLGWVLFQRRFGMAEQRFPKVKKQEELR